MRALRVHEFGGLDALTLESGVEVPEPGPGEVRVRIEAIGVNFADILMIGGRYQLRPDLPFSPGFEVAGTIDALGPGVEGASIGAEVTATPWYGGYAEHVVLPAKAVFSRPGYVDAATGAAATVAFGTAYHALVDRAGIRDGETLVVTGATGGVGSAALQVGRALGAFVIAAVGSEEKALVARDMGADEAVTYGGDRDLREQIADAAGGSGAVDVAFDVVGGDGFGDLIRELRPGGRALIVGFTDGSIPTVPANILLLKEAAAQGIFWGAFREREPLEAQKQLDVVWGWIRDGVVKLPSISTYPMDRASEALADLAARRVAGKVVLVTDVGAGP